MSAAENRPHPSSAILAAFIEGSLPQDGRADVIAHVSRCAECRFVLASSEDLDDEAETADVPSAAASRRRELHRMTWLTVAAVLALFVAGALILSHRSPDDPLGRLAAAMATHARTVEPRLSGGFRWAPLRDLRRTATGEKAPDELVAAGAADATLREVSGSRDAAASHAAGVAYLFLGERTRAVETLDQLTRRTPRDAKVWSDLAAALYCDGIARADNASLRRALEAANRAIEIDPALGEGYFNRALILERVGNEEQARWAWNSYVSRDPASAWAGEARNHLRSLSPRP